MTVPATARWKSCAAWCEQYPGVKVVEFNGNFGQHMAILAAFEMSPRRDRHHPGCRPAEPARGDSAPGGRDRKGVRRGRHHPPEASGQPFPQAGLADRQHHHQQDDRHADERLRLHAAGLSPQRHRQYQPLPGDPPPSSRPWPRPSPPTRPRSRSPMPSGPQARASIHCTS